MVPDKIPELVERFGRNRDEYRAATFNEANLRQQFVNPFFKCLGWDMDNERGASEANKDVVHEAALRIGGAYKAPDYGFRLNGLKFYVEAKKPAVPLKDNADAAYQLRRYAWSAKL